MVAYSTRSPGPVWAELRGLGEEAKAAVSSSAYWTSQSLWPEFWRQERRNACEEWSSPNKRKRTKESKKNIFMRVRDRLTGWVRRMRRKPNKITVSEHRVDTWRVWLSQQRVLQGTVTWGDGTVRVFAKCDKHGDVTEKIMVWEKAREQKWKVRGEEGPGFLGVFVHRTTPVLFWLWWQRK